MTASPALPRLARWRVLAELGLRMMLHDKAKLVGTLMGVIFAVVLGVQQLSILFGLLQKNTMFIDNSAADLWIVPPGTTTLQTGGLMSDGVLARARSTEGVALAEPLLFQTATLKKPSGGTEPVTLVGTSLPARLGGPWNFVAGGPEVLEQPDTVVFEDSEREKYGGLDVGSVRELAGQRVRVGGFTWGLLPFGPAYAFTELGHARDLTGVPADKMSFVLVKVRPGQDVDAVKARLAERIPELTVVTRSEYSRSVVITLLKEQLGASFATSTSFGLIIGFVIVALSMFSSVLDNLREFGTLKAIGCTNLDLALLLFCQAALYALAGSLIGLGLVGQMAEGIRGPKLVPIVPPVLLAIVPALMLVVCVVASTLALSRIRKLEPGMVFR
ncbi:MAG: FtsX-like permease family protein [Polyangiaceae bacterium]|jgi:putative ABC transport system permease protein|nr:FtsX-like permease family protein [Polyangiaceae bacterium]MBK8940496.1 FtsX-like permease family protein [Polyangiaceae bacterium]